VRALRKKLRQSGDVVEKARNGAKLTELQQAKLSAVADWCAPATSCVCWRTCERRWHLPGHITPPLCASIAAQHPRLA
jgi:hypothetical protein